MRVVKHWHCGAERVLPVGTVEKFLAGLQDADILLERSNSANIREELVSAVLDSDLWVGRQLVFPGRASIYVTAMLDRIALCIQLGNVARYYADILKLQQLYENDEIDCGILLVYTRDTAHSLHRGGGNLATFERVVKELGLFKGVVNVPMLITGAH